MTSIERTAYPRFKRVISAGELHGHFKPTREEVSWASQRTDSDGHLLALVLREHDEKTAAAVTSG